VAPSIVLIATAALFVLSDMLERYLFPSMSIGLRHALLTARAAVVTAAGTAIIYVWMRRQQERLSDTAQQITRVLEAYRRNPSTHLRFENPYLVNCRDVVQCSRTDCVVPEQPGARCWQILGLHSRHDGHSEHGVNIEKCHECTVYLRSCPDKLYELGEAFNNLMYLLDQESQQVGRMRSQMLEKEKMVAVGQMAAGIAHEVCNPLSSISSVVQLLKRGDLNGKMKEQLSLIETHIQRITATVRQLVSLARPGTDRWEQIDLATILRDTIQLLSFDRRARRVQVILEAIRDLPRTYGVRGQLQQVFINLMINALDAMPDGGVLRISAESTGRDIIVSFADTGSGISPEIGRRVFEPFFTTKEPGKGTGMGLSVTYTIVQKHGGTIDFVSQPNEGTTFTLRFPILDSAPEN